MWASLVLLCGSFQAQAVKTYNESGDLVIMQAESSGRTGSAIVTSWRFFKGDAAQAETLGFNDADWEKLDLPHTWNAEDGTDGGSNYYRGAGWYRKKISISEQDAKDKRIYIEFEGVNEQMKLYINGVLVGSHKGGYTTFRFDVTDHLKIGAENLLAIRVSNEDDRTIAPISGDFTFFGGIYRNVSLIFTDEVHIDLLDNGSPGVYLTPKEVSEKSATLRIDTAILNDSSEPKTVSVRFELKHPDEFEQNELEKKYLAGALRFYPKDMCGGGLVQAEERVVTIKPGQRMKLSEMFRVAQPRLWNGMTDPYRYQVNVTVSENEKVVDGVSDYIGFRTFNVEKETGFYLNGSSYPLRGVCMHQDYGTKGNAVSKDNITESFSLLYEIGANTVRLSHYPHSAYTYELCDKYGITVYAEIPFVNTYGGNAPSDEWGRPVDQDDNKVSYENPDDILKGFISITNQQLIEMIKQQYNCSSIFCWGLFNEAQKADHDVMVPLIAELNALAHKLDPSRLTVMATFSNDGELLQGDLVGWNTYPKAQELRIRAETFYNAMTGKPVSKSLDNQVSHSRHDVASYRSRYISDFDKQGLYDGVLNRPVGLSEYGRSGRFPRAEEIHANWHETWIHDIRSMNYLWGTYVWNLFEFSADNRPGGYNDKGLVLRDRQMKKDAFYIYKAHWRSDIPVIYLTGQNRPRREDTPSYFKVYSNCDSVTLYVDGKEIGTIQTDDVKLKHVFEWSWTEPLGYGEHVIRVVGHIGSQTVSDQMTINRFCDVPDLKSKQLLINNEENQICIKSSLTAENVATFISNRNKVTVEVREADGQTPVTSGKIKAGMTLLVTAEDGHTSELYAFVKPTPAMLVSISVKRAEKRNPAKYMMDGDPDTRWSGATGTPTDILLDFGQPMHFSKLSIKWYQERAYRYTVQLSTDGKNYTTVADRSKNTQKGTISDTFAPRMARYVKINVSGNSDKSKYVSIYEINADAWKFETIYAVNEELRTITVPYDPGIVISKLDFIEALGLGKNCSAEVDTGGMATVYYITDGATLIVSCGEVDYEYTLIYR